MFDWLASEVAKKRETETLDLELNIKVKHKSDVWVEEHTGNYESNSIHLAILTPSWCRVQTTAKIFQLFFQKFFDIQIVIAIYGFSIENALKWVQTSLVLVQQFLV